MFTIPNKSLTYPFQSRIFQCDLDIIQAAAGGRYGVVGVNDCQVTESASPDMNVDVSGGQIVDNGTMTVIAGQSVGLEDADPLLPRFDLVVAHNDGTCTALTGTPDAAPLPLSPVTGSVGLAQVFVPALDSAIEDVQIVDKRIGVPAPIAPNWTRLSCASDLSRINNASLADDPVLQFSMSANGKYRIRMFIAITVPGNFTFDGIILGFHGPGTPAYWATSQNVGVSVAPGYTYGDQFWAYNSFNTFANYPQSLELQIVVHNGATPGTFAVAWGQLQASANPTVRKAGSYLEYEVV